ncbi:related to amidases [Ramularia collo-cygni]|uniref:amidase n=1 Tax=Ramularia collo-cygni TaxID=112498 RepID=A0A2D3VC58_9PEZI|nr:related to amidases [Ramularia collo-cygni]CZT18083.1 related to amidases [Ramularia collo-cygni]
MTQPWEERAAKKRAELYEKIPLEWRLPSEYLTGSMDSDDNVLDVPSRCGLLSSEELEITEKYNAITLAKAVQSGSLKAKSVATAFCKRAAIAQQLTSCLTETFFNDAIERGEWLDQIYQQTGKPVGPLHGVPVSLKECFNVKNHPSCVGMVSFLDRPVAEENSFLVDILLDLGAILYCKTNIPVTMMSADSENNVFGRVLNPHRLSLGAGGSSGGEGALIALRGSVLGVGTDIAGSVRIPALCNGTYGFKPTTHRIPTGKQASGGGRKGSPCFSAIAGPLANTFEDLVAFTEAVLNSKPWNRDPTCIGYPWRAEVANAAPVRKRIGYFIEDPELPLQPPVLRALENAAKTLTAGGFELVPLSNTPSLMTGFKIANDYFSLDNSKMPLQHILASGEPIIRSLLRTMDIMKAKPTDYTLDDLWDINVAAQEYKAAWHKQWVENDVDVVLCAGAQTTAVPHDTFGLPHYTTVWSLLEYAAVIIPTGKADKAVDVDELARSDKVRTYKAEEVHGAPMAIQLVARNYHDEELIALARAVDQCLKENGS